MSILIDQQLPAYEVRHARRWSRRFLPRRDLLAQCNSYRCVVGPSPGRALLLMARKDVLTLMQQGSQLHTLAFKDQFGTTATIPQLFFLAAWRITSGFAGNQNHLYITQFADFRWAWKNPLYEHTTQQQFNVRAPAAGQTYYQDSLNAGNPYTWQQILDTLWGILPTVGPGNPPSPQLPQAVQDSGTPENIQILGTSTWEAYNQLLERIGCAFAWDPIRAQVYVYTHVNADALWQASAQAFGNLLVYDTDPQYNPGSLAPAQMQVWRMEQRQNYGTEQSTGWAAGSQETMPALTGHLIAAPAALAATCPNTLGGTFDDLPILLDFNGMPTNAADVAGRDQDCATAYYNALAGPALNTRSQIYQAIMIDQGLTAPRSWVSGVCWRESGAGFQTEIVRYPPWTPPDVVKFSEDGPWKPWGMGTEAPILAYQPPNIGRNTYPLYPPLIQPVQITSLAALTPPVANIYAGNVQRGNPAAGPPRLVAEESCWCWFPNGETPALNFYVPNARLCGAITLNSETSPRPLYLCMAGGGGGAAMVFGVANAGSVAVAANVSTPLRWNAGRSSFWSAANPTRLTVPASQPAGGCYLLAGEATFAGIGIMSHLSLRWCKNGSYSTPVDGTGLCDNLNQVKIADIAYFILNGSDYVELVAWHDAPTPITVAGLDCWIDYKGVY